MRATDEKSQIQYKVMYLFLSRWRFLHGASPFYAPYPCTCFNTAVTGVVALRSLPIGRLTARKLLAHNSFNLRHYRKERGPNDNSSSLPPSKNRFRSTATTDQTTTRLNPLSHVDNSICSACSTGS